MILTKLCLSTIKSELDTLTYDNFLYIAPQNATYPFVTFFPVANPIEYTFGQVLEDVNVQLSIFDDDMDVETILDMAQAIETAFDELTATDGTYEVFCTHRVNESGPTYMAKEHYWQLDIDLKFKCQRNKA